MVFLIYIFSLLFLGWSGEDKLMISTAALKTNVKPKSNTTLTGEMAKKKKKKLKRLFIILFDIFLFYFLK